MGRRNAGKLTKKNRVLSNQVDKNEKAPHSFIIHRGTVGRGVRKLQTDLRDVMQPNTAMKLKASKKNSMKDFVAMSGPMNVTQMVILSRTDIGIYIKICKFPRGPTVTFSVDSYILAKDIIRTLKKHGTSGSEFEYAPCLMTNLQSDEGERHHQLVCKMFLDLFPTLNPNDVKIHNVKRCCLLNYEAETDSFDFRHYLIKVVPVGVSKAVKKLIRHKVPDLSKYNTVADFVQNAGLMSESEGEDDASAHVDVKHKQKTLKSSIRLVEIGPRISMKLVKIQEGLLEGNLLYNKFVKKTAEEKLLLDKKWAKKKKLKQQRTKEQEENIEKKKQAKEEHKEKCLAGMKFEKKDKTNKEKERHDGYEPGDESEDDDAKYYEEEVGEKPDPDAFQKMTRKRRREEFENRSKVKKQMKRQKLEEKTTPFNKPKKFSSKKNNIRGKVKENIKKYTNKNKKSKRR